MPSFNRTGDSFLAVCDGCELRHYGFPQGSLLVKLQWPFDDMDNQIGDQVLFVNSTRALLPSTADRLYLVDLAKMAIAGEIGIAGYAPQSISEVYPSLLPNGEILSVHKRIPVRTPIRSKDESGDSILTWRLP